MHAGTGSVALFAAVHHLYFSSEWVSGRLPGPSGAYLHPQEYGSIVSFSTMGIYLAAGRAGSKIGGLRCGWEHVVVGSGYQAGASRVQIRLVFCVGVCSPMKQPGTSVFHQMNGNCHTGGGR